MKNKNQNIVIKKIKKYPASGHHGGMWKVAYADFITAMMVLFLMLWIINNVPQETLSSLGNYFEPTIFKEQKSQKSEQEVLKKIEVESAETSLAFSKLSSMIDTQNNRNLKLEKKGDTVSIIIESSDDNLLFEQAKAPISPIAKQKLDYVAKIVSKLPYYITIGVHTNGLELPINQDYGNWNLSLDRVNNVRKFLMSVGISDDRIISVTANSNSVPKYEDNPGLISNRRIEILLITNDDMIAPSKKNLPTNIIK